MRRFMAFRPDKTIKRERYAAVMSESSGSARSRWTFAAATFLTVLAGLISRRLPWVPAWVGDLLWATTVFYLISAVMPRMGPMATRGGGADLQLSDRDLPGLPPPMA